MLYSHTYCLVLEKQIKMDWKEIERVDEFIKRTEKELLETTPWDGIRNWQFYMEVEARMKKAEKNLDKR